jgi:RNA polymerase sigma factor (sigma-70 family)
MELGSAYHPQSFSPNIRDADASFALSEDSPITEALDMSTTKRSIFWDSLLSQLEETEARVLKLYFFEQRTQKDIADSLSTSQMNVSRLMRKALGKLRGLIVPEDVENLGML